MESIIVKLSPETKPLWKSCFNLGHEMRISENGTEINPRLEFKIIGLDAKKYFSFRLHFETIDGKKMKFSDGKWVESDENQRKKVSRRVWHPSGRRTGEEWLSEYVNFDRIRITNQEAVEDPFYIHLHPYYWYIPVLTIVGDDVDGSVSIPYTRFIPVTEYHNDKLRPLKTIVKEEQHSESILENSMPSEDVPPDVYPSPPDSQLTISQNSRSSSRTNYSTESTYPESSSKDSTENTEPPSDDVIAKSEFVITDLSSILPTNSSFRNSDDHRSSTPNPQSESNNSQPPIKESPIKVSLSRKAELVWKFRSSLENVMVERAHQIMPTLEYSVTGLDPMTFYTISMHFEMAYNGDVADNERLLSRSVEHKDGMKTGEQWMSEYVDFSQIHVTTEKADEAKSPSNIHLYQHHRYIPVLSIYEIPKLISSIRITETQFYPENRAYELKLSDGVNPGDVPENSMVSSPLNFSSFSNLQFHNQHRSFPSDPESEFDSERHPQIDSPITVSLSPNANFRLEFEAQIGMTQILMPILEYSVTGLDPMTLYSMSMHFEMVDRESWMEDVFSQSVEHMYGMQTGEQWMSGYVNFNHIRISTGETEDADHPFNIHLYQNHKYIPVLNIFEKPKPTSSIRIQKSEFYPITKTYNCQLQNWNAVTPNQAPDEVTNPEFNQFPVRLFYPSQSPPPIEQYPPPYNGYPDDQMNPDYGYQYMEYY